LVFLQRETQNGNAQPMLTLSMRLREFMKRYRLNRDQMASIIRTPRGTFDHWLDDDVNPPACMLALMDLLEERSQVRTWLGVHDPWKTYAPRGRPFLRGNEWRFTDKRRQEALAGVRAIKSARTG
jgi:hypothetical protein